MKVISYSIFQKCPDWEFKFYLRGLYFNVRMNRLIYPGWRTFITYDYNLPKRCVDFIWAVAVKFNCILVARSTDSVCEAMLWRMIPVLHSLDMKDGTADATHVICRDADALTTYREAQAVQEWVDSGLGFHSISDNQAHSLPMMGGMVGFKVDHFKATFPHWDSFEKMISGQDLSKRGSDQDFMMKHIYPKAKGNMVGHFFKGCREVVKITRQTAESQIPGVSSKLWESNLCPAFIGAAGVNEMETLRFFKRFDKNDYSEFEKQFPQICHWVA